MLFAQAEAPRLTLFEGLSGSAMFGVVGIALLLVGYFLFDLLARRLDVQQELAKGNVAVAIVVGALLFSIAYIAAHVVH